MKRSALTIWKKLIFVLKKDPTALKTKTEAHGKELCGLRDNGNSRTEVSKLSAPDL
jgi:hypothetical protein